MKGTAVSEAREKDANMSGQVRINRGFRVRKLVDTGLECEQDRSVLEHEAGSRMGFNKRSRKKESAVGSRGTSQKMPRKKTENETRPSGERSREESARLSVDGGAVRSTAQCLPGSQTFGWSMRATAVPHSW